MAIKYYAVRKGFVPGIYDTWEDCKKQVTGFKCAEYKSFKSIDAAEEYFAAKTLQIASGSSKAVDRYTHVYVDGSFNQKENKYGWAFAVYKAGKIICEKSGYGTNAAIIRNIAGELSATMHAVKWLAQQNVVEGFIIHHDYIGIANWINGSWRAKDEATQAYVKFMSAYKSIMQIQFNHVDGHTGVEGNEYVDKLAKLACGIV